VPGSSRAESAAAAVARLVPIAIGGDGGGSTRLPSALSGVIGFHPTRCRVPPVDYLDRSFELTNTDAAHALTKAVARNERPAVS
jgi:Asp-tRNA(Asn)/Glu-tRNA(Gln) amidotransferase A subunit family amidase